MTEAYLRQPTRLPGSGPEFGPPPIPTGHIPAVRLKTEIANTNMDPPQCVQNAMMKQDKKPFTYTPGGINLSEIKSPRMQRRIEINANAQGVGESPKAAPPPPQNLGNLPPSTLAAMRPQPQVQVFPGPPPPPPMQQRGMPPPPPPPMQPLPTTKVVAGGETLERPDMTKIIPENPMALLRKTGGPAPRKSLVDEMFAEQNRTPPSPPQRHIDAQSPRYQQPASPPAPQRQPQPQFQPAQVPYQPPQQQYQSPKSPESPKVVGYQPPVIERREPVQNQPTKTSTAQLGSLYIPPANQQQKNVSPPTPPEICQQQVQSPGTPTLKEGPKPWQVKSQQKPEELPAWARRDEQIEREDTIRTQQTQSPPAPTRWQTSPQTAPSQQQNQWPNQQPQNQWPNQPQAQNQWPNQQQPQFQQRWQPQQQQQPQSQVQQPLQQRWQPQPQPAQTVPPQPKWQPQTQPQSQVSQPQRPQGAVPVHIEIRTNMRPEPQESEDHHPNAVYITQPIVLQHPGPRIQPAGNRPSEPRPQVQQTPKVDSQGARIIPIQIERTPPSTPGTEKTLTRQQSWGNPSQSNSFKVIQKLTQTDDDEDDDTPITQHSARYPQHFQQAPADQMRKMKLSDGDRDLMNRFKQVPQQNVQQQQGRTQSRTIPVQIEGNGHAPTYVHPSEQTVPEPKKYTGSSIPSRSFKILQAMTAPDACANVNHEEDNPYETNPNPSPFEYMYPSAFYPPPYWHPYYYEQPVPSKNEDDDKHSNKNGRSTPFGRGTPMPFWAPHAPPPYYPPGKNCANEPRTPNNNNSNRDTPVHFWYPPYPSYSSTSNDSNADENQHQQPFCMYPMPYFDPYYYSYYYGYPPMVPHYPPYYHPMEEPSGYSSMDEMGSYSKNSRRRRGSMDAEPNEKASNYFQRSKSATPRIIVTPTSNQEDLNNEVKKKIETVSETESDSTETDTEDDEQAPNRSHNLQSIRSVPDINIYATEECTDTEDTTTETSDDTDDISVIAEEEIIPHQLSVIFEESERTESRMIRSASAMSDSTTIAERSDNEDDNYENVHVPMKFTIQIANEKRENISVSVDKNEVKSFENQSLRASYDGRSDNVNISYYKGQEGSVASAFCTNNEYNEIEQAKEICMAVQEDSNEFNERKETDEISKTVQEVNEIEARKYEESDKESDEDWWSVLGQNDDDLPKTVKQKANIDSENTAQDFNVTHKNIVCETSQNIDNQNSEINENELKVNVVLRKKKNIVKENISVYDKLRSSEEQEEESTERIMEMESFVEKLEQIKRNSGLWNNFNIEDNSKATLKGREVTPQDDFPQNKCEVAECNNSVSQPIENEETEEVDFWSQIKDDSDDDFKPRRRSYYRDDYDNYEEACSASSLISSHSLSQTVSIKEQVINQEVVRETVDSSETTEEIELIKEIIEQKPTYEIVDEKAAEFKTEQESDAKTTIVNNVDEVEIKELDEYETTDTESTSSSSSDDDNQVQSKNIQKEINNNNEEETEAKPLTIKERIKALHQSINIKQKKLDETEEVKVSVKEKISLIEISRENVSKNTSTKSSVKSFEEYSEEEGDSGVLSDISRHISDTEEFPELKKLTRYERAATHSRLFKLLQEECDNDDEIEEQEETKPDKFAKLSVRQNSAERKVSPSRSQLSLPLKTCTNTLLEDNEHCSHQINEKLVSELVQSLLKKKKGQMFRNMPKEKLHAAAIKILQEDYLSCGETPEELSSLLSPLRGETENSTPAQTPQEFYGNYHEYKQYYESWGEANINYSNENEEIFTSKAFRLLREHIEANKIGTVEGLIAKCPRILSSKNVNKELLQLLDGNNRRSNSQSPEKSPEINEVTNTS